MSSSILLPKNHFLFSFPSEIWFTISHRLYWEQGRTSSPLTWPFISWRNAVTTPICSALILDPPWLLSFPRLPPNLLPSLFGLCRQVAESVIRASKWQCSSSPTSASQPMSDTSDTTSWLASYFCPLFFFSLHIAWLSKTKWWSRYHRGFFPFSSCKLQKHGRISFWECSVTSLRFSLLFSFDSPEFFCESFCLLFLDARWYSGTLVVSLLFCFLKLQIISNWLEYTHIIWPGIYRE